MTSLFLEHLPASDRGALLAALAWLTRIDDLVTASEKAFLGDLGAQLHLSAAEIEAAIERGEQFSEPAAAVRDISVGWVRELLLQQLVAAAFCDGAYDARERRGIRKLAKAAEVPFATVESWERAFARGLYERMEHEEEILSTTQEILAKRESKRSWSFSRIAKVAAGGLLGGGAVALTGGATTPALLAALGASGAVAVAQGLSRLGDEELPAPTVGVGPFGESAGDVALQLFGDEHGLEHLERQARSAGYDARLHYLEDRSGLVVIGAAAFTVGGNDQARTWRALEEAYPFAERYALEWEDELLGALDPLATAEEWLRHYDEAAPRARALGPILAETIVAGHLGRRPVTFVAFGCATEILVEALRAMGSDHRAMHVDSIVLLGGTAKADDPLLGEVAGEIGGMLFNGFCNDDGYLEALGGDRVGLRAIFAESPRVRNLHLEGLAGDHFAYAVQLAPLLEQARARGA